MAPQTLAQTSAQHYETVMLRTLNAFAVDLISIPSAEDLFWYVAQNVVGQLHFVDCVIYEADRDQTELIQVAALGEKNPFGRSIVNPLKIQFGQGITGRVAKLREAIIVDDLLTDSDYIPDTQPARSEICVPMMVGNRVLGVIDSEHPSPAAFGHAEREFLTTVAAMTSAKLELLAEAELSHRRYQELVDSHAQLTREINSRKALEAQLFEARKLEAVGRLSGGFAHDFNNLLTVISGNLDLLHAAGTDASVDAVACLGEARAAADRGAVMIRNMLSFSQRSRLQPNAVDLPALVRGIDMQAHAVEPAVIQCDDGLWPVWIDLHALGAAIETLLLNASEAMQPGAQPSITLKNVHLMVADVHRRNLSIPPGRYVQLGVADTGAGIAPDHLPRIFDPYFTTKTSVMGAGLSLSALMGFVQQSGGAVDVTSELGKGSTFHLYLPAHTSHPLTDD
ncbi:MAG: ATP-binding protein [Pseudomonadota bacterium]